MDKDRKDIIKKIEKLMAIANDSAASDQEIQLSAFKANKLMIQYKISEYELLGESEDKNVLKKLLDTKSMGYCHWILRVLAKHFRCKTFYIGKINTNNCTFGFYGLEDDLKIIMPIAEALVKYLDNKIKDLKECYVYDTDFRKFKRSYLSGFADGLDSILNQALLEMKINEKYEIAVIGVPVIVQEYYEKNINHKKSSTNDTSYEGYELGKKDGRRYDVKQNNLLDIN